MSYVEVVNKLVKDMKENDVTIHDLIAELNEFSLKGLDDVGKPHICIGMPINREVTAESFSSLMMLYSHLNKNYRVSFTTSIATYLHEGRHLIVKNAYEIHKQVPVDYMLWLDSDMVYTPNDFDVLLRLAKKKDLSFVSGLYFTKRSKACRPVYMVQYPDGMRLADNYPENTLLSVDGVGFGFFLCKGQAIFDLYKKYKLKLFKLENGNDGRMVGEDIVFSRCVKEAGYKLYVYTGVCLGHEGGIISKPHFHAVNSKEILDKVQWESKSALKCSEDVVGEKNEGQEKK